MATFITECLLRKAGSTCFPAANAALLTRRIPVPVIPVLSADSRIGKPRVPSSPLVDLFFFRRYRECINLSGLCTDMIAEVGATVKGFSREFRRIRQLLVPNRSLG